MTGPAVPAGDTDPDRRAEGATPADVQAQRWLRRRPDLAGFFARERERGTAMPHTFRTAVSAELGQAFCSPYQIPIVVVANALLMMGGWFLLPRGWLFTLTSPLAFPVVLSSWMYADVPATNVLAPDRNRVLAALADPAMLSRLLLAKAAVLWLFVAPVCSVIAVVVGVTHHSALLVVLSIVAICVVPPACLPLAALVGIWWPYHPLQLRSRWDNRVPSRHMIVRWLTLAVAPYLLVPALCMAMVVPAGAVLYLTNNAGGGAFSRAIGSTTRAVGLSGGSSEHPAATSISAVCVALTCVVAAVVWWAGRRADLWLIARRGDALRAYLADPTLG